ncbi:MAG: sulfatase [Planctomycetota bacterium]
MKSVISLVLLLFLCLGSHAQAESKPNVLFIAVDDLNHWLTHLGRNPQAQTPNFDRLARLGVTFTNAHTAVPACEPSRCALMSGRRPWTSGCYKNGHAWKNHQAVGEGLSAQFLKAGYHVAGAGKIYHGMAFHPKEWSEYLDKSPFSQNGPGVEKMDGYHLDVTHPNLKDEDLMDWHTVDYCIDRISRKQDQPFFVACGLYKPHLPFVVPRKYYDAFPLDEIELPPHIENDLDDVPRAGVKMASPKSDHAKFLKSGRWKAAIQSYLATCSYTDMNLGRLLDALESSPNKDNTIICLWSDHGWSLGEKQHWRKFALWEETTRVAYLWVVPGMTKPGTRCERSVDLMSVYPTLCELTGIEKPVHVSGQSIVKLLKDPAASWGFPAITTHGRGNHSVKTETHRYIRYQDGSEELYDVIEDPYEWKNLAGKPSSNTLKTRLAKWLPGKEAPTPKK